MTVLGAAAGHYVGKAIMSLYASGGSVASTVNEGVARTLAKYVRGTVSKTKGKGWIIKFKSYTLRVMNSGGGRKNYMRLSRINKGSMTVVGKLSNDRAVTHIPINIKNLVRLLGTLKKLK